MFIVIKSEHYDCTNLICKKDTLEEAVAAVKDSMAQRINKNYHTGLTDADITHENEERYRFSFDFDLGNTCAVQFLLQVCADVVVLYEVICEITLGIPFGIPVFNNTDSQAVWINFLSHDMSSLFLV